jgi:hypothetical protein
LPQKERDLQDGTRKGIMGLFGKRKVMVAVDDSEISSYAFTWGLRNLIRPDDHVIVLTAAPLTEEDMPSADIATGTGSLARTSPSHCIFSPNPMLSALSLAAALAYIV